MRASGASRDQQHALPPRNGGSGGSGGSGAADLPLLPLFDHVLLPGGFLRVTIPASWRKSSALVDLLLQRQGGEVLVAAVPYLTGGSSGAGGSKGAAAAAAALSSGAEEEGAGSGDDQLDLDRLHHTGTAARVLQLVRRTQVGAATAAPSCACRAACELHLPCLSPPRQNFPSAPQQASPPQQLLIACPALSPAVWRLDSDPRGPLPPAGAWRSPGAAPASRGSL